MRIAKLPTDVKNIKLRIGDKLQSTVIGKPLSRRDDQCMRPMVALRNEDGAVCWWVDYPEIAPDEHEHIWEHGTLIHHRRCELCGLREEVEG